MCVCQLFCLCVDGADRFEKNPNCLIYFCTFLDQEYLYNFRLFDERMGTDPLKIQKEKAKIFLVLAHSLYMMSTLSKNQMIQITAF